MGAVALDFPPFLVIVVSFSPAALLWIAGYGCDYQPSAEHP
jgi:hypothetical protein